MLAGCSVLPPLEDRAPSTAVFDTRDTRLGKEIVPLVDAHPGLSGAYLLSDPRDAFAARALLAKAAERTLDIRYYIWRKDISGTLLAARLVPGRDAERVRQYLQARAVGKPRAELRGVLDKPQSTLISIERNALTYAGHTVWNRHQETSSGGYVGGTKFRPKEEWVVQRDTHPALINEAEAEVILAALDSRKRPRARASDYLLTGMLVTPSGAAWWGIGDGRYRNGSKNVAAAKLEQAIVGQIGRDLRSPAFVTALVKRARAAQHPTKADGRAKMLRRDLDDHERRMAKIANCIPEMKNPRPLVAKLEEMDAERARLLTELKQAQADRDVIRALCQITEKDVESMLDTAIEQMEELDQGGLKNFLRGLIGKIELDPATLTCRMHYRIPLRLGVKVASPGRPELNPQIEISRLVRMAA